MPTGYICNAPREMYRQSMTGRIPTGLCFFAILVMEY
jgi:hypothetical protein